jgi:hypothetical protein
VSCFCNKVQSQIYERCREVFESITSKTPKSQRPTPYHRGSSKSANRSITLLQLKHHIPDQGNDTPVLIDRLVVPNQRYIQFYQEQTRSHQETIITIFTNDYQLLHVQS